MNLEKLVKERIKENEKLFTMKELKFIKENDTIIKKVYFLGILDSKDVKKDVKKNNMIS